MLLEHSVSCSVGRDSTVVSWQGYALCEAHAMGHEFI